MLKRLFPKRVSFRHGRVSLRFDGRRLSYRVKTGRARNHVGEWHRAKPLLLLDAGLKGLDRLAVALHEAIEKYLTQAYGLDVDSQAHPIAESIERRYVRSQHAGWRSHQMRVWWLWRKRGGK